MLLLPLPTAASSVFDPGRFQTATGPKALGDSSGGSEHGEQWGGQPGLVGAGRGSSRLVKAGGQAGWVKLDQGPPGRAGQGNKYQGQQGTWTRQAEKKKLPGRGRAPCRCRHVVAIGRAAAVASTSQALRLVLRPRTLGLERINELTSRKWNARDSPSRLASRLAPAVGRRAWCSSGGRCNHHRHAMPWHAMLLQHHHLPDAHGVDDAHKAHRDALPLPLPLRTRPQHGGLAAPPSKP